MSDMPPVRPGLRDRLSMLARYVGNPWSLAVLAAFAAVWLTVRHGEIGWSGWLGLATMASTIIIQASQNRDTAAIHAKLDELLRVDAGARDELRHSEDLPERVFKSLRE